MLHLLFILLHPIYMSYMEIRHNEDRQEYELLIKVFTQMNSTHMKIHLIFCQIILKQMLKFQKIKLN